ncbi:MAG TPA: helix-turn-helix domain-containing protein [Acidimicrobiales bacterium]
MPDPAVATTDGPTSARLIRAAEGLFADRGIDAVSLREINRVAGARNASALQYHFGGRDGLLRAVLRRHQADVEARRHAMLDAYEAAGRDHLRGLAGALVRPLAAKLADADGGPAYLQIVADLTNRPRPVINRADLDDPASSVFRWRTLVAALLDNDATRLHRRFTAIRFTTVELARRARSAPHTDDRLFTSHLVDLVTGLLTAPLSDETRRLDQERPAARTPDPSASDPTGGVGG